jgi:hypothetical protein
MRKFKRGGTFHRLTQDLARQLLIAYSLKRLSWSGRGVAAYMIAFLWSQVDHPGRFIIDGKALTQKEIGKLIRLYQSGCGRGSHSAVERTITKLVNSGWLRRHDGDKHFPPHFYIGAFTDLMEGS